MRQNVNQQPTGKRMQRERVLYFGAKQAIRIALTCHLYYAIVARNFIVLIRDGQHSTLHYTIQKQWRNTGNIKKDR